MAGKRGKRFAKRMRQRARKFLGVRRKRTVNVNNALQPIPQRYICKMKYAEAITLDTTGSATGLAAYRWNLNSVNDPNRTGGGHKPYGYSTLLGTPTAFGLYNRYRVISCTYNIFCSPGAGQAVQLTALPANESVSSGAANGSALRESPRSRYITQVTGAPLKLLSGKVYLPSLMGRNKTQYMADDRYQAVTLFDPAELAVLNVYLNEMSDATGATIPVQAKVNIELTYTVELFDMNIINQTPGNI